MERSNRKPFILYDKEATVNNNVMYICPEIDRE